MIDYQKLYCIMVQGAERALCELEKQNYGAAAEALIAAQRAAEEAYLQAED